MNNSGQRAGIPVNAVQVPSQGYSIALYFDGEGRFVQKINQSETRLHPWLGLQLEAFREGRSWKRDEIGKYEPLELMDWLKAREAGDDETQSKG